MNGRTFVIVANKAVTAPFGLNDLTGGAGRMDLVCRSVGAALFLSHDIRRDVTVYLVLLGRPDPPKAIRISGAEVRYMGPDERNIAGLIRKALKVGGSGTVWRSSTPGIHVSSRGLEKVVEEVGGDRPVRRGLFRLTEEGGDLAEEAMGDDPVFLLGDHEGITREQAALLADWMPVSLGGRSYHTDHCITVVNHHLDVVGGEGER